MATIVTTDAAGTLILSAELLGGVRPNMPYVVEADGEELLLRPQNGHALNGHIPDSDEWGWQWREVQKQVGKVWNTDKSAAEIIAEMRR